LIDAAWANCGRTIGQATESLFGVNAPPAAILLTHVHPDHDGSALELARLWGCRVYVPAGEWPLAVAGDLATIERCANPLDRWLILPVLHALPRRRVAAMLSKGSLVDVARAFDPAAGVPGLPEWTGIPTPGHSPGHVAFFRERDQVLLAGDALLTVDWRSLWGLLPSRPRLALAPSFSNWSGPRTRESVATLARLEPGVVASGHGTPMMGDSVACDLHAFAARVAGPAALPEPMRGAAARRALAGTKGAPL
jgi:glyoxylase-like metal-dependent hydrolase (beta-lactamase superfamily II)